VRIGVGVVFEDRFATVAAIHDVTEGTRVSDAQLYAACSAERYLIMSDQCQLLLQKRRSFVRQFDALCAHKDSASLAIESAFGRGGTREAYARDTSMRSKKELFRLKQHSRETKIICWATSLQETRLIRIKSSRGFTRLSRTQSNRNCFATLACTGASRFQTASHICSSLHSRPQPSHRI